MKSELIEFLEALYKANLATIRQHELQFEITPPYIRDMDKRLAAENIKISRFVEWLKI